MAPESCFTGNEHAPSRGSRAAATPAGRGKKTVHLNGTDTTMAINWTQEQSIPNTFMGGYQSFTPDMNGFVIVTVAAQGETQSQLGLALVGDSVARIWVPGGTYVYSGDSIASLPGSATFPVAANDTFLLGAFSYSTESPAFSFWWIPAWATSPLAAGQDDGALRHKLIALAEQTKPAVAALQAAGAA